MSSTQQQPQQQQSPGAATGAQVAASVVASFKQHPLQSRWCLWYDSKKTHSAGGNWEDALQLAYTVATVEEFWAMLCVVKKPQALDVATSYSFFRAGAKPVWEHPVNANGGKWSVLVTPQSGEGLVVEALWEEILMALVGEYLDDTDTESGVVGGVLSRRKAAFVLSVWTRDKDAMLSIKAIGARLRQIAPSPALSIEYTPHGSEKREATCKV
jgi:translation initiation factor 4E